MCSSDLSAVLLYDAAYVTVRDLELTNRAGSSLICGLQGGHVNAAVVHVLVVHVAVYIMDADGLQLAIDSMQDCLKDVDFDVITGLESRGFIFGMPIAYNLHKPFVLVRKAGKLPCETVSRTYDLEYGSATIEMHKDSIKPGQKVVIIDDLIATGGSVEAAIKLVEELGGIVVKVVFLMELAGLKGRERLKGYDVASVIRYDGK